MGQVFGGARTARAMTRAQDDDIRRRYHDRLQRNPADPRQRPFRMIDETRMADDFVQQRVLALRIAADPVEQQRRRRIGCVGGGRQPSVQGLDHALGLGFGIQYTPGARREEIHRLFQLAADEGVTSFVHIRYAGLVEPGSSIEAVHEMIANAASTGAGVHIVHIGSSGLGQVPTLLSMIEGAPETVIDNATFESPTQPSSGIEHVIVGGTFVVRDAELIETAFPGQAIRRD